MTHNYGEPLPVTTWFEMLDNNDDVTVAEVLLKNIMGQAHRFNAHNTMQVINLMTAVRLSQFKKQPPS